MRKVWSEFEQVLSTAGPHGARHVKPEELVAIAEYKKSERIAACAGIDPISALVAYAQDSLIYDDAGNQVAVDAAAYARTPREKRVNVFGLSYRPDATLWLHRALAEALLEHVEVEVEQAARGADDDG